MAISCHGLPLQPQYSTEHLYYRSSWYVCRHFAAVARFRCVSCDATHYGVCSSAMKDESRCNACHPFLRSALSMNAIGHTSQRQGWPWPVWADAHIQHQNVVVRWIWPKLISCYNINIGSIKGSIFAQEWGMGLFWCVVGLGVMDGSIWLCGVVGPFLPKM